MKKMINYAILALFVFAMPSFTTADVKLPSVLGAKMVLQRDIPLNIWGWANPGEKVTVSIVGQTKSVTSDVKGNWKVKLDPIKAGGPFEMTVTGKNKIILSDILIGDVWICSGQSNMEMRVCHIKNAVNEVADAYHPNIRLFNIKNDIATEPSQDCKGEWDVCRPSTIGLFSAVGYFFGRELNNQLDIPIGLINSSWGGTVAEAWMSMDSASWSPEYADCCKNWEKAIKEKPADLINYYRIMSDYEEDIHHLLYAKKGLPKPYATPPEEYKDTFWASSVPSWIYNRMISPLTPFGIKGAIWYQGESNAGRAYQYRNLFPALIKNWREKWGEGNFPFLFVQLTNFAQPADQPGESEWAELREAQTMTLSVPNTAMAVTIDIGEADDVHPRNKQDVGKRLALGALKTVYGKDIVASGPIYKSMQIKDGKVYISFDSIGSGLVTSNGDPLKGFAIAGKDKKFIWANASIEGDKVVVWSADITEPASVRYGWANNPVCNLFNKEGLPASPFRTDVWPGITLGKK